MIGYGYKNKFISQEKLINILLYIATRNIMDHNNNFIKMISIIIHQGTKL